MSMADDVFGGGREREREGERGREMEEGEEGRSWWMVTVSGREGVLNKQVVYRGLGQELESVTTSNSYIIIVKDKEKKKTGVDSVACPLSKSRGVQ